MDGGESSILPRMTKEQRESLAQLLREFGRMTVEISCLRMIAAKSETLGIPVREYRRQLEEYRQRPENIAAEVILEQQIRIFEAGDGEVTELLRQNQPRPN